MDDSPLAETARRNRESNIRASWSTTVWACGARQLLARDVTPLRLARVPRREHAGAGPASLSRGLDQGAARGEFGPQGPPRCLTAGIGPREPTLGRCRDHCGWSRTTISRISLWCRELCHLCRPAATERDFLVAAGLGIVSGRWVSRVCSSKALAETYGSPMSCRVEVFVRSGHTIDLALEDGEDRAFAHALREAWASPETIGFTHLALGENAVILASEVVGYRLHGTLLKSSTL